MTAEKKARLRAKLAGMPFAARKAYLARLKEKRAARLAAASMEDGSKVQATAEQFLAETLELGKSKSDVRSLRHGLTLFDVWKGLRALATVLIPVSKSVSEIYRAGVVRRSEGVNPVAIGAEIASVDPEKLEAFVKSVPGVWAKWGCDDASCAECPYHRGKGVSAQNRDCAEQATKIAMKHNRAAVLYAGMPFSKKQIDEMSRKQLVSLCGVVKVSPFSLKDGSKAGLAKLLLVKMKAYKAPKQLPVVVKIPRLTEK